MGMKNVTPKYHMYLAARLWQIQKKATILSPPRFVVYLCGD
jgi:hypothetical protein